MCAATLSAPQAPYCCPRRWACSVSPPFLVAVDGLHEVRQSARLLGMLHAQVNQTQLWRQVAGLTQVAGSAQGPCTDVLGVSQSATVSGCCWL